MFKLWQERGDGAISEAAMLAAHDLHPDFGLLCPTKRLARRMRLAAGCVLLALVAGAVLRASLSPPRPLTSALVEREAADAVIDSGQASTAMIAAPSLPEPAQPAAGNTDCERDNSAHRTWSYFQGRCGANKGRNPLRAATERPPLAGVALGHTAPAPQSAPALAAIPSIIAVEQQTEASRSAAITAPQTEATTEPSHRRSVVAAKRPQKTARRENRRRDIARRDVPWWREVRATEWGARAYGGGGGDYARGGYVREGFFGDMR